MTKGPGSDDLETLADTLWAQRQVVEFLLYRLVTAKLVLEASERRFVPLALEEVERLLEALRLAEVRRAAALEPVARAWGYAPEELTLHELGERAPAPMNAVFQDHHEAFLRLAEEIEVTADTNRRLATAALSEVQKTLGALTGPPPAPTYTAAGTHDTPVSLATVGANATWLSSALQRSGEHLFITRAGLSEVEDADDTHVIMDLQVQDMALQATLQAIARALPPTLTSFLR